MQTEKADFAAKYSKLCLHLGKCVWEIKPCVPAPAHGWAGWLNPWMGVLAQARLYLPYQKEPSPYLKSKKESSAKTVSVACPWAVPQRKGLSFEGPLSPLDDRAGRLVSSACPWEYVKEVKAGFEGIPPSG